MRARQIRSISDVVAAIILVVIVVALIIGLFFYAHRYFLTSGPEVGVEIALAGETWSISGGGSLVLQVIVDNRGGDPAEVTNFTVYTYTASGLQVGSPSSTSPPLPVAVPPHSFQEFTLIVNVPGSATGVSVSATVRGAGGGLASTSGAATFMSPELQLTGLGGATGANTSTSVPLPNATNSTPPPNACPYGLHIEFLNETWSLNPPYMTLLVNVTTYYSTKIVIYAYLSNSTYSSTYSELMQCYVSITLPPHTSELVDLTLNECAIYAAPNESITNWWLYVNTQSRISVNQDIISYYMSKHCSGATCEASAGYVCFTVF